MEGQDHVPEGVLVDFLEERLEPEAATRVRMHLESGCMHCAGEMAAWRRVLSALGASAAPAPPESVARRAIALFDRATPTPSPCPRISARLTFDSRVRPVLAGARDAGEPSFQLLFAADETEIDLLCERESAGWHITGQALAPRATTTPWQVHVTGVREATAETDPHGEFTLAGLPPGAYDLCLRGTDREILLPTVRLEDVPD